MKGIHSISHYLLSVYFVPCTVFGASDTSENKTEGKKIISLQGSPSKEPRMSPGSGR